MLLVARRKQQLNTEMGRKHISGDVGLMTFDKDSQSPSLLFLWTSRDVFSMLSKWIWHQSVRAGKGWKGIASAYCSLLRLNRKRNWLEDKLTYDRVLHGPTELRALPAHARNLQFMIDGPFGNFYYEENINLFHGESLPACLFARPVEKNLERRRRTSEKFCGIFQRKNVIRK